MVLDPGSFRRNKEKREKAGQAFVQQYSNKKKKKKKKKRKKKRKNKKETQQGLGV